MEDLLKSIGAEPVKYPMRNECCGAYISFKVRSSWAKECCMIIDSALASGAEEIVTACPLCLYNLNKYSEGKIKVTYFTELLAEALGVKTND